MYDWEDRLPVDDYGNEVHWSYVRRGFSCLGASGWQRSLVDIATDNEDHS